MERVPCTKEMRETCKYVLGVMGCHSSIHHEYWPRRDYSTPTEKRFRELDDNKISLPRCVHDDLHAVSEIPAKPSVEEMLGAIAAEKANGRKR